MMNVHQCHEDRTQNDINRLEPEASQRELG